MIVKICCNCGEEFPNFIDQPEKCCANPMPKDIKWYVSDRTKMKELVIELKDILREIHGKIRKISGGLD